MLYECVFLCTFSDFTGGKLVLFSHGILFLKKINYIDWFLALKLKLNSNIASLNKFLLLHKKNFSCVSIWIHDKQISDIIYFMILRKYAHEKGVVARTSLI
ncbi:hypothetical protein ACOSQ4_011246 [Xanthoceras sorbifolium]